MIATGGLLRINARRQDSLRRNEVVVVKGKVKLCSASGLVAVLGVLVLLGGIFMAVLGYWPRDGLFFSTQPQEGAAMASVSSRSSTPPPADLQGGEKVEELDRDEEVHGGDEGIHGGDEGIHGGDEEVHGGDEGDKGGIDNGGFNQTESINGTSRQLPRGFLEDFLDRYLYSDRLKVLGPLIMGIGIFLFICANAVLHENRDKKTKVINLRDIYSTVIDLHSLRKPTSSSCPSSANPLNGLINYVQSKSLETKSRAFPSSLLSRKEGGDSGGGLLPKQPGRSRAEGGDEGGDGVFSIYQEQADPPLPPSSSSYDRHSLPSSPHASIGWTPQHKEALCSFTLPLRRPRPPSPCRRHSIWGAAGREEELRKAGGGDQCSPPPPSPPPCASTPPPSAPGDSQALLLLSSSSLTPSHLSHSSLSHLLSSSTSTPAPPCRRRSLPTVITSAGYSKLSHGEEDSFEWSSSQGAGEEVTSQRRCSNRWRQDSQSEADLAI